MAYTKYNCLPSYVYNYAHDWAREWDQEGCDFKSQSSKTLMVKNRTQPPPSMCKTIVPGQAPSPVSTWDVHSQILLVLTDPSCPVRHYGFN
jgi:hypothetical protein